MAQDDRPGKKNSPQVQKTIKHRVDQCAEEGGSLKNFLGDLVESPDEVSVAASELGDDGGRFRFRDI